MTKQVGGLLSGLGCKIDKAGDIETSSSCGGSKPCRVGCSSHPKSTGDKPSPEQELQDLNTPGLMKTRLYSFEEVKEVVNQAICEAKLEAYNEVETKVIGEDSKYGRKAKQIINAECRCRFDETDLALGICIRCLKMTNAYQDILKEQQHQELTKLKSSLKE